MTLEPGGENGVYTCKDVEQVYIILRDGGTVQVGEEKEKVKASDAIFLPAQISHGFFNASDKRTIFLLIGTRVSP